MRIDYPTGEQIPRLQQLWQESFQEDPEYLSTFFSTAFSPDRCQCLCEEDALVAAVYWMDCRLWGKPVAYIYALAVDKRHRRRGLGSKLMAHVHQTLKALGYAGIVLVPGDHRLRSMYAGMGYETATFLTEISVQAGETPVFPEEISARRYAEARKNLLPMGSVLQEGACLDLLERTCRLYQGNGFLLAAAAEGSALRGVEFLGDPADLSGILKALGKARGSFRTPGSETPFAMWLPLTEIDSPKYFGFAFD